MNNFYTPDTIRPLYNDIIPAYQAAFAVAPWNEVSKCVDEQQRCEGGLSATTIGSPCSTCSLRPTRPAYEADELIERFDTLGATRPTAWYAEQNNKGVTMAAVAWRATPFTIASEKYAENPSMNEWITQLDDNPVMWLDEVFANRELKSRGNLQNFGRFVLGLAQKLECPTVTYRTIEPRMTAVATRDFGDKVRIMERIIDVPDRRDFVIIDTTKEVA